MTQLFNFLCEYSTFFFLVAVVIIFICLFIIILVKNDKITKLKIDVNYWKQQSETANNVSKDLQRRFDEYESRIIEVSDSFKPSKNKKGKEYKITTERSYHQRALMRLENEILNKKCIRIVGDGLETITVSMKIIKPI